jgi:L-threonylcarbamoyladenylate synthase
MPVSSPNTQKRARIFRGTPANLARLARALRRGELVAVPTETVYGLAGNALSPRACEAIFQAKGRPANDPLIVHIHRLAQLDALAHRNAAVAPLARAFWPGPLTLVLPKKPVVPGIVTSGLPSVAIRMPAHPGFRALLKKCGLPLAAPSANPFGYISPTLPGHVRDGLGTKIRHILDGGQASIGLESTILDVRDPRHPVILRPGAISAADISRVLGARVVPGKAKNTAPDANPENIQAAALAPGLLTKHYSPRLPLALHKRLTLAQARALPRDEAVILLRRPRLAAPGNVFWLSETGGLDEAARQLFAVLRALDVPAANRKRLHIALAPGRSGLALAINDRLTRAAARR